jgi:hypothetical protein
MNPCVQRRFAMLNQALASSLEKHENHLPWVRVKPAPGNKPKTGIKPQHMRPPRGRTFIF